jgi:IS30 family transposase
LHCPNFEEESCSVKSKPPYVCNGCTELPKCTLLKRIYDPADAHEKAHSIISEARTGIMTNEDELHRINDIISPLVRNGHSLHQVYLNHVDDLMCSEKTLYNYVDAQLFDVRNIDLPRKVKYRPRYKKPEFKVDRGCRIGRNYLEFQKFLEENPETTIVQMDSVIGRIGGKCLLTLHFVETSLMLAFLRDANTSGSVLRVFNSLDEALGAKTFSKLFPVILTDNGSEFSNPKGIEYREVSPYLRTRIFYCDPSSPYQKGACEVNHELIRRILPKGSSFDDLTQEDIVLMMNHINSYKRKKLNNRSPYDTFSFYYGEDLLKKLGCSPVAAENIILKPKLLKK